MQLTTFKKNPGKAHSLDGILNEYLIEGRKYLAPFLVKMLNYIFNYGYFPDSWSSAIIIPIHKNGDCSDPNNFRGISLISSISKLFTSILNGRLVSVCNNNYLITDAQFGFCQGASTTDAMFALHVFIPKILSSKKDYTVVLSTFIKRLIRAYVDRLSLWYRLSKLGKEESS